MTGNTSFVSILMLTFFISYFISACGGGRPPIGPPDSEPTTSCNEMVDAPFDQEISDPVQLFPVCYSVERFVEIVEGGSLNIPPNTVLVFGANAGLMVHGGSLSAQGTQDEPILFTGRFETPGYWAGIYVHHSNQQPVTIQNSIVRFAGGKDYLETGVVSAAIALHGDSSSEAESTPLVKVSSNRIEKSGGYGVYLGPNANLEQFTNNVIRNSQEEPVNAPINMLQRVDTSNDLSENRLKQIYVQGGDIGEQFPQGIVNNFIWPQHEGLSYFIAHEINIFAPVTISPGTTLVFASDTGINVTGQEAYLSALGTEENKIVFTGKQEIPGYWKGITYNSTTSPKNELNYVQIKYAGAEKNALDVDTSGITLALPTSEDITSVSINNSEISFNDGFGFKLHTDTGFTSFENNRVFGNTRSTGMMPLKAVYNLSSNSQYSGNGENYLLITPADLDTTDVVDSWPKIDVPYRIIDDARIKGALFIDSGVTIEIAQNKAFVVEGPKALFNANGIEEEIKFTKIPGLFNELVQGNWAGLYFINAESSENLLDNVTIESAGAKSTLYNFIYPRAAIMLSSANNAEAPSRLSVYNTKVLASETSDICYDQATDLLQGTGNVLTGYSGTSCPQ